MQKVFNDVIKQDVKPFLANYGFARKKLNFYHGTESLHYMFHFQKSAGNSADHVMFYVNCGIYASELAQLQAKEVPAEPQESECHFRARIGEIAKSVPDRFSITPDTDRAELSTSLLGGLEEVIHFYEKMTSARSIVDYYTAGPYLHLGEESFRLLLQSDDTAEAHRYLKALQDKYGSEQRWAIFENKYRAIFEQYGVEFALRQA